MLRLRSVAPVLFCFSFSLLPCATAQFASHGGTSYGNVHVRVVLPNGRSGPARLLVQLMDGSSNTPQASSYTDDMGLASFLGVTPGYYHVVISGDGYVKTDSDLFEVDTRKMTQNESVTIQPVADGSSGQGGGPMVSAAALNIPQNAVKEFDKANSAMEHQDWKKALERLNRAIAIAPTYAAAYNNAGVVYGHMNDLVHEREALEKAISLDDHFMEALVNLAKVCFRTSDFAQAQNLLERVLPIAPNNIQNLLLLANAQLLNKHYDAAIATAQKVHTMAHEHSPLVHYIAARAYEHENRPLDALAQLQVFLQEEPKGERADHVRNEIQNIRRQVQ